MFHKLYFDVVIEHQMFNIYFLYIVLAKFSHFPDERFMIGSVCIAARCRLHRLKPIKVSQSFEE
jgi:hypothetical protein